LVTETVIRPSPVPFASTDTFSCRIAVSRSTAGGSSAALDSVVFTPDGEDALASVAACFPCVGSSEPAARVRPVVGEKPMHPAMTNRVGKKLLGMSITFLKIKDIRSIIERTNENGKVHCAWLSSPTRG
jgi:hypothetical protein